MRREWYTEEELELYDRVSDHIKWYSEKSITNISTNGIFNLLLRGDIRSIDRLVMASPEEIEKIHGVGRGVKFGLIMALKIKLEESKESL